MVARAARHRQPKTEVHEHPAGPMLRGADDPMPAPSAVARATRLSALPELRNAISHQGLDKSRILMHRFSFPQELLSQEYLSQEFLSSSSTDLFAQLAGRLTRAVDPVSASNQRRGAMFVSRPTRATSLACR